MKLFKYCLIVMLFSAGCSQMPAHNIKMYEGYKNNPALLLHSETDFGENIMATGFAIDANSILTVGHFCSQVADNGMFEGGYNVKVGVQKENLQYKLIKAYIVAVDEKRDLCLLLSANHGAKVPKLEKSDDLAPNDDVWVVGIPLGFNVVHSYGKVLSTGYKAPIKEIENKTFQLHNKLITTTPSTYGMSGSPLFNADGRVVGVCLMRMRGPYDHFAIFATLKDIYQFLYTIQYK